MLSPFEQAILLGVIQGLTEFLPISSDGHLALAQMLIEMDRVGLSLIVLLHTGTLLAILVYFRKRIALILSDLWQSLRQKRLPSQGTPGWDALIILVASVPTAIIALALRGTVARWTQDPLATGFGFILTALVLISTLWAPPGSGSTPTLSAAVWLGIAQGIAVAPGVSRSGCTIVAALWLGMRAERAFELSMLLSIPAVGAAILFESAGGVHELDGHLLGLAAGAAVAFGVGMCALSFLRRVISHGHLSWFALWVLPLALATLALAKAMPN